MKRLTERQRDVFNVMIDTPKGKGGNLRVWGKMLKMTPSAVYDHLILMEKKGVVKRVSGEHVFDGKMGWYPTVRGIEIAMENRMGSKYKII